MHAMMAVWVPPSERSSMAGLIYSGAQAGTVLSLPLSGLLCDTYGWSSVFYVFGCLGLVWWVAWCLLVYNSPSSHPRIDPTEQRYIISSLSSTTSPSSSTSVPWRSIFSSSSVWALIVAHACQNYGFYTLLTELPSYMANVLHFNIRSNSLVSALPYLAMLVVANTGTRLADFVLAKGLDRTKTRKIFNSFSTFLPAIFLISYSGCNTVVTVTLLCLAVGFNGFHYAGFMCCHLDLASNYAGTLLGITNGISNIMGFVAPAIAGYITEGQSDIPHWRMVFFLAAVLMMVGNTVFLVLGSAREEKWNRPGRQRELSETVWEQDDY